MNDEYKDFTSRYQIKVMGVQVTDTAATEQMIATFSTEQWKMAKLLIRCYPMESKVPGIKFLKEHFNLNLREAKMLFEAAAQ